MLGNIVEREPAFSLLPVETPASIRRLLRRSLEKQSRSAAVLHARRDSRAGRCDAAGARTGGAAAAIDRRVRRGDRGDWHRRGARAADDAAARADAGAGRALRGRAAAWGYAGNRPAAARGACRPMGGRSCTRRSAATRPRCSGATSPRSSPSLIAGTEGATAPFFSPDGRWLGFVADGELKRIPLAGGAAETIAPAAGDVTAAWTGRRCDRLFDDRHARAAPRAGVGRNARRADDPESRAGAIGFTCCRRRCLDAQEFRKSSRKRCAALHDRHRLGAAGRGAAARDGRDEHPDDRARTAVTCPDGHLIFSRDNTLWIAPFDAEDTDAHRRARAAARRRGAHRRSGGAPRRRGRREHGLPARRRLRRRGAQDRRGSIAAGDRRRSASKRGRMSAPRSRPTVPGSRSRSANRATPTSGSRRRRGRR